MVQADWGLVTHVQAGEVVLEVSTWHPVRSRDTSLHEHCFRLQGGGPPVSGCLCLSATALIGSPRSCPKVEPRSHSGSPTVKCISPPSGWEDKGSQILGCACHLARALLWMTVSSTN